MKSTFKLLLALNIFIVIVGGIYYGNKQAKQVEHLTEHSINCTCSYSH
jgi:hypothetical protein